jgi:ribonuclease P protein subunit POP4
MRGQNNLTLLSSYNIIQHELIGLKIKILEHSNPNNLNIEGIVVDESKNTLTIESNKLIQIAKEEAVFLFNINGENFKIKGKTLLGRPEDRIKRKIKRKW